MKRNILLIIAVILSLGMKAETVSEETAMKVARNLLSSSATKSGNNEITMVWNGLDKATKASDEIPPFYVFNRNGGGFVIVSAEDAVTPVLAYSHEHTFSTSTLPENVKYLTDIYTGHINVSREHKAVQSAEIKGRWENMIHPTKTSTGTPVVELETALWSQGDPYNLLCPTTHGGEKTVTGCTATAMAIVMRYYEWPKKSPNGSTALYIAGGVTVPKNKLSEHTYDWSNMPLQNTGNWTDTQENAVAQLIYDCGTAIKVTYGADATSGYMSNVVDALHNHMWYEQCYENYRQNYSDASWLALVKWELDNNYPLIYSGDNPSEGGHAFVIDGYDSANYLRVNFGWAGSYNGYWLLNDMNGFTDSQSAIVNLRPNEDYSTDNDTYQYVMKSITDSDNNIYSMMTNPAYLKKGETFTATASIWNAGSIPVPGTTTFRFCHMDKNGNRKGFVSDSFYGFTLLSTNYYTTVSCNECKITEDIKDGDYLILAYKKSVFKDEYGYIDGSAPYTLKYDLMPDTGLDYNVSSKSITFHGRANTSYKITDGSNTIEGSFKYPVHKVDVSPLSGKTCTLTLDNGNEKKSIEIVLP